MKWGLLLHVYQPPNQRPDILDLVSRESYEGLFNLLLSVDYPITLNVTGVLTEQLKVHNKDYLLDKLRQLYQKPNISFTNTAYTHALLPLWPESEIKHQLETNRHVQQQWLNPSFAPRGTYLPECAYSPSLDQSLIDDGAKWVLIDEKSLLGQYTGVVSKPNGLVYIVRHRQLSQDLATDPDLFQKTLESIKGPAIVALDGEAFGHFDSHSMDRLRLVLERHGSEMVSLDHLAGQEAHVSRLRAATWETSDRDLRSNRPFPLWHNGRNRIHRALWGFYRHVYRAINRSNGLVENEWVRRHFDASVSSCYFWWANLKRTAGPFKMKIWNPDVIVMGIEEAIKAVRSDPNLSNKTKWQLETEHADLLKLIWRTHWKKQG